MHQAIPHARGRNLRRCPRHQPQGRTRPVRLDCRPHRLRQIHDPQHGGRAPGSQLGRREELWATRERSKPPGLLHVPAGPPPAVEDGDRQRESRPDHGRRVEGGGPCGIAALAREGGAQEFRGPLPAPAQRRHAQAHSHRPGLDRQSRHPAHGRALFGPRRADAPDHGERASAALAGIRQGRRLHHP